MKCARLNNCRGWTGQKFIRKSTSRHRRRMERDMLRSYDYEKAVPNLPTKGWL